MVLVSREEVFTRLARYDMNFNLLCPKEVVKRASFESIARCSDKFQAASTPLEIGHNIESYCAQITV